MQAGAEKDDFETGTDESSESPEMLLGSVGGFQLVCEETDHWRVEVTGEDKIVVLVGVVRKDAETEREGKKYSAWIGVMWFKGVAGNERVGPELPMAAMKETTDGLYWTP